MNLRKGLKPKLVAIGFIIVALCVFKDSRLNSESRRDLLKDEPGAYICKQFSEKVDSDHAYMHFIYAMPYAPDDGIAVVRYYKREKNGSWQAVLNGSRGLAMSLSAPRIQCKIPHNLMDTAPTRMTYAAKPWERQPPEARPGWELRREPELAELYERKGAAIVAAPASDLALARSYRGLKYKGEIVNGVRKTIMTRKQRYRIGEPVRVIHVLESVQYGPQMSLMGPEPICTEYVDDKLADNQFCHGSRSVSGGVTWYPSTNFNFDISTYRFNEPGIHTIRWKSGYFQDRRSESNLIKISIEPK